MRRGLAEAAKRFQYADYRRRIDARAVLDYYGVENDYEIVGQDGTTEVVHSCLLDRVERHHSNGDANPSAACNLDNKLYVCYSYWGGDLFHLIMKMEGKDSLDDIVDDLGPFLGESTKEADSFIADLQRVFSAATGGSYSQDLPSYDPSVIGPWAFVHPYLNERGIDADTASRLHIGWREDTNRLTIPQYWMGKLVGWQSRAIPDRPGQWPGTWGGQIPKYLSSPGFPKSDTLYCPPNYSAGHLGRGRGIVVESPFSVIKAAALGVSGVVATFGAKITRHQLDLLSEFDELVVWMDDGDAGWKAERRIVPELVRKTRVRVVTPDYDKDLADLDTADEVNAKIDAAVPAWFKIRDWAKEASHG